MPVNNGSEQEVRPSVIFRNVTNGFRSVTGTARRQGQSDWTAIRDLIDGTFDFA